MADVHDHRAMDQFHSARVCIAWRSPRLRCRRVSPIRFSLTGAARDCGAPSERPVRRAAKRKTLFIMLIRRLRARRVFHPPCVMTAPAHAGGARREISGAGEEAGRARVFLYPCTELRRCGRQLDALIEGGTDHPGRSFLGPQWPANLGSVSWRWLCRLKGASCEKAGIFASAFQRVAMPQNLPFADLAVLPAGLRRRVYCGHPLEGAAGCVTRAWSIMWQWRPWLGRLRWVISRPQVRNMDLHSVHGDEARWRRSRDPQR